MDEVKKSELHILSTCAESWRSVKYIQLNVFKRYALWLLVSSPFFIVIAGIIFYSENQSVVMFRFSTEIISIFATFIGTMIMVPLVMSCLRLAIHLPQDEQVVARECRAVRLELMKLCIIYAIMINVLYVAT
jgi:hypothetical protein